MNRQQFLDYIAENYSISGEAFRLIDNILLFVDANYHIKELQVIVLWELLNGTIGMELEEVKGLVFENEIKECLIL